MKEYIVLYLDIKYTTAMKNGCKPKWYNGILGLAWHCMCKDMQHAVDSQCSVIDFKKLQLKR